MAKKKTVQKTVVERKRTYEDADSDLEQLLHRMMDVEAKMNDVIGDVAYKFNYLRLDEDDTWFEALGKAKSAMWGYYNDVAGDLSNLKYDYVTIEEEHGDLKEKVEELEEKVEELDRLQANVFISLEQARCNDYSDKTLALYGDNLRDQMLIQEIAKALYEQNTPYPETKYKLRPEINAAINWCLSNVPAEAILDALDTLKVLY